MPSQSRHHQHNHMTPNITVRIDPIETDLLPLEECCSSQLHMSFGSLKLKHIEVNSSKLMALHLGITLNLEKLRLNMCTDMTKPQIAVECPKLKHLEVSYAKLRALDLGLTLNP
ncbi:hypothetical protein Tco_0086958 [Tanacetum coccineum]